MTAGDGREPLREGNEALLDDDNFHVPGVGRVVGARDVLVLVLQS